MRMQWKFLNQRTEVKQGINSGLTPEDIRVAFRVGFSNHAIAINGAADFYNDIQITFPIKNEDGSETFLPYDHQQFSRSTTI